MTVELPYHLVQLNETRPDFPGVRGATRHSLQLSGQSLERRVHD